MIFARECEFCGGPIPDGRRIDAMYCSKACRNADYNRLDRAERLAAKAHRPPCLHCGAPIPAEAAAHRQFCSLTCQRKARRARDKAARPVQTCPECGTGFKATAEGQVYCGTVCAQAVVYRLPDPIVCGVCGTEIARPRQQQRYCGRRCKAKANKAARRARAAAT